MSHSLDIRKCNYNKRGTNNDRISELEFSNMFLHIQNAC